jgi:hypothetical protein
MGNVGRPRGTGKPIMSKHKTMPQFLKGSTGRSTEELFNVSPKIQACLIEEDYRKVKKDPTAKMSMKSLKYLKDKGIIKTDLYFPYAQISERKEERTLVTENGIVEQVNSKLIWLYENA